jgi:hypothetical protein
MRSLARLALVAVVVAAGPLLSACNSFDLDDYAFWDSKKKLPGDRKPVFPEGVPGVAAGVPPELVRGYREPEGTSLTDPAKAAAEAAAADAAPKPKPKPAPLRVVSKPPPKPQAPPDPYAAAPRTAAAPATAQSAPQAVAQPAPQAGGAPWPAAQPQAAWPGLGR